VSLHRLNWVFNMFTCMRKCAVRISDWLVLYAWDGAEHLNMCLWDLIGIINASEFVDWLLLRCR
jgi:hypothetical protein